VPKLEDLEIKNQKILDKEVAAKERKLAKVFLDGYKLAVEELTKLYSKLDPSNISLAEAKRYNNLMKTIDAMKEAYTKVSRKTIVDTEAAVIDGYMGSLYRDRWAIEKSEGIAIDWENVPIATIREAIYSEEMGYDFIKTLRRDSAVIKGRIEAAVNRGIALGKPLQETAMMIKTEFNRGYYDAVRVVRTETGRARTEGQLKSIESAENLGIKIRKKWRAAGDSDTRQSHLDLDGELADDEGLFWSNGASAEGPGLFGVAEEDINCRCTLLEVIEDWPESESIRYEDIPDYEEWAKSMGYDQKVSAI
jgi:hypothetical protein